MELKFWGTRGSIPAPLTIEDISGKILGAISLANGIVFKSDDEIRNFIDTQLPFSIKGYYGTNTSCVEILDSPDNIVILDSGSGIRNLGQDLMMRYSHGKMPAIHIFLSHLHWDHIQGFPFFLPAYMKDTEINIYGYHDSIENAFRTQQQEPFFPVQLNDLKANIIFHKLDINKPVSIADYKINGIEQNHPGISYGYGFEKDGIKIVYSTDSEHKADMSSDEYPFIEFFKNADALVFDAQYIFLDSVSDKEDWGHSSNVVGVDLSIRANVRNLFLFHTEPTDSDSMLEDTLNKTRHYAGSVSDKLNIHLAYDGLVYKLN